MALAGVFIALVAIKFIVNLNTFKAFDMCFEYI